MITQIGIVMLGVRDLVRSVAFYGDQLGLTFQQQMAGFAYLDAGAVTLCLSEPLAKAREQIVGATEIVFPVQHVRVAFSELREKGVEFVNEPRVVVGTSWAANFVDPDGHLLSVFGPE
jgi:predicted enzyme related to lactoylglutathione lyase